MTVEIVYSRKKWDFYASEVTMATINIRTPSLFIVILCILKFEQIYLTIYYISTSRRTEWMANNVDTDQTAPVEPFDPSLHCLLRHVLSNTESEYDKYSRSQIRDIVAA